MSGPWEVDGPRIYDSNKTLIATVGYFREASKQIEIARLIAAAPELLAALIEMEREKSDYMTRNNLGNPAEETTNKMARSAISKATGGAA